MNPEDCITAIACFCDDEEACPGHCSLCGEPTDFCQGHSVKDRHEHYQSCPRCSSEQDYQGEVNFSVCLVPAWKALEGITLCGKGIEEVVYQWVTEEVKVTCPYCKAIIRNEATEE